jgi:aminoglycoside/choline kinase family phosphotransferase
MQSLDALESRLREVCRAAGLEPVRIEWLPAALSLRRFARIHTSSPSTPTAVARIEMPEDPGGRPAGAAPEPPHEPIRALLERAGLPVPRRLGGDPAAGIELLEDVGALSLQDASARLAPAARADLFREACELVPRIQAIAPAPGVAAFARSLDAALFAYKADLVVRYGLAARGRAATPAEAAAVRDAFAWIAAQVAEAPQRLAHRDFQSANLFVLEGAPRESFAQRAQVSRSEPQASGDHRVGERRPSGARLRMIDVQGAFLAPPEYDLVCLLCDSYVELAEPEIAAHGAAVRPLLPDAPDPEAFARRFDWLTLTRKGKDHARFLYAARERGDERYLAYAPATVRHLRRAAARASARDARLADLAALVHELPEAPCAR